VVQAIDPKTTNPGRIAPPGIREVEQLSGSSDRQDPFGVVAQAGDRTRHQAAGRLSGDAEALADLTEALALTIEQPEPGFDRVPGPSVERAEQFVEEVTFDERHH